MVGVVSGFPQDRDEKLDVMIAFRSGFGLGTIDTTVSRSGWSRFIPNGPTAGLSYNFYTPSGMVSPMLTAGAQINWRKPAIALRELTLGVMWAPGVRPETESGW